MCRATSKLNFIVYEKKSDATTRSDSSIGKFFDEVVNDQLANKYDICIKDETSSGESLSSFDGTSYNIYTQTTKFKELDTNTYISSQFDEISALTQHLAAQSLNRYSFRIFPTIRISNMITPELKL